MSPVAIIDIDPVPVEAPYATIDEAVATHEAGLETLNKKIHGNPELGYEEFQAHDNICNFFEDLGYSVTRQAYGVATSFEVEYGHGGRVIVFNAEYDALPGIGHACGHNLIATSSAAAFIATAEAIRQNQIRGRVRLLGTPAEECGGGKIRLIRAGAYEGVDACLMGHPAGIVPSKNPSRKFDGTSAMKSLARKQVYATFQGTNAHAGLCPWEGKNALDAVVASYVNISLLRQQTPPSARIHGVIRNGGAQPNIIPDSASLEYFLRADTAVAVDELAAKVEACFKAGALATGCTMSCSWQRDEDYKDLCPNEVLTHKFTKHMSSFGKTYLEMGESIGASTDMGNVCYEVPGLHCAFTIGIDDPQINPHHPKFAIAAGTKVAFLSALSCGKGLAATAYDLLSDDEVAIEAWNFFEEEFGRKIGTDNRKTQLSNGKVFTSCSVCCSDTKGNLKRAFISSSNGHSIE